MKSNICCISGTRKNARALTFPEFFLFSGRQVISLCYLDPADRHGARRRHQPQSGGTRGTQFTCCTRTKVQILTQQRIQVQISASNVFDDPVATKTIISASDLRSQNFLVRFLVADASFLDSSSAGYYLRARARNVLGTGPYSAVEFTGEFSVFTACLAGFYMRGSEGSGTCEPCPAFGQSVILLFRMLIISVQLFFILIQSQRIASSPSGSEDIAQCKCTKGYTGPDGQLCTVCTHGEHYYSLYSPYATTRAHFPH